MIIKLLLYKFNKKRYYFFSLIVIYFLFGFISSSFSIRLHDLIMDIKNIILDAFYKLKVNDGFLLNVIYSLFSLYFIRNEITSKMFKRNIIDGLSFVNYYLLILFASFFFSFLIFILSYIIFYGVLAINHYENDFSVILSFSYMVKYFLRIFFYSVLGMLFGLLFNNGVLSFVLVLLFELLGFMMMILFYSDLNNIAFLHPSLSLNHLYNDNYYLIPVLFYLILILFLIYFRLKYILKYE